LQDSSVSLVPSCEILEHKAREQLCHFPWPEPHNSV